jgi:Domain of unknown function (DUF4167)
MRTGPNKRSRGRNNNNNNGGGGGMMNGQHGRPRPPHRQQTFDSNGPGIKIRGNAYQVFERYVALAREAASAGDRVAAENLYQHAEHYFRVMNANGENPAHMVRPTTPADPMPESESEGEAQAEVTSTEPEAIEISTLAEADLSNA